MKCAIITPVGPGHAELYEQDCLKSIETAIGFSTGPFDEIIPMMMDDTQGLHGRSARRNEALQEALAAGIEWVFFLDADDLLAANAFEVFGQIISAEPELDAVWGLITNQDEHGELVLREGQVAELNTREEFLGVKPYFSIQIGSFMRTEVVARYGFDTEMDTGEDFKLYYQLWKHHRCAKRPTIFFINRVGIHSSGPRSADGRAWVGAVHKQWADQLKEVAGVARLPGREEASSAPTVKIDDPLDHIQNVHSEGEFFARAALDHALCQLVDGDRSFAVIDAGVARGNSPLFLAEHSYADPITFIEPDRGVAQVAISALNESHLLDCCDISQIGNSYLDAARSLHHYPVDLIHIDQPGNEVHLLEALGPSIQKNTPLIWVEMTKEPVMAVIQHLRKVHGYRPSGNFPNGPTTSYFFSAD